MRYSRITAIITALVLSALATVAVANHTGTALYTISATFTNSSTALVRTSVAFPQSASLLIDNGFIAEDALNTSVQSGSTDIPAMPASNRINMLGAVASTTVLTTQTTQANNNTPNDMTLFNTTSTAGEAYYFGADTAYRVLTLNVGTAGAGTYQVTWQYYNGASWANLSGVIDNTSSTRSFDTTGTSTIAWTMPDDMATTTVNSIVAYWTRARLTSGTVSTAPRGTQAAWETGQWWVYADGIANQATKGYTLYLGGTSNLVDSHQIFVGSSGVTTTDAGDLELGSGSWEIALDGFFKTNTSSTAKKLVYKPGTLDVYVSQPNTITATITGTTTTKTVLAYAVSEGEHEISLQYVAGTGVIRFYVDGVASTSTATAITVDNTADEWQWGIGGSTVYFNSIKLRRFAGDYIAFRMDSSTGEDSYTDSTTPDTNYGTSVAAFAFTCVSLCTPDQFKYGWFEWDISDIPATATITAATSTLFNVFSPSSGSVDAYLRNVSGSWAEDEITFNNQPGVGSFLSDAVSIAAGSTGNRSWDVTTAVNEWFSGTTTNNGLRLETSDAPGGTESRVFRTREIPTAEQRPLLEVSFTDSVPFNGTFSDANNFLWYELRTTPTVLLQDESGNGNSGRLYWPEQQADTLAVTVGALTSLQTPSHIDIGAPNVQFGTGISTSTQSYATSSITGTTIPIIGPILEPFFTYANIPSLMLWVPLMAIFIIGAGVLAMRATSSLFITMIVTAGLAILAMVITHLIAVWVIFGIIAVGLGVIIMRPGVQD